MSHAATYGEFYVIHNGDYSGKISINVKEELNAETGVWKYKEIASLPMWLLEHIVVAKVRQERISALEDAGIDEILGLKKTGPIYD